MVVCSQCGRQWPDDYVVCPDDGSPITASLSDTVAATTGSLALARPDLDDEVPPGTVAGEYVIETKLGQGGMGAVYGARHPLIGKRAAVKVINRELSANPMAVDRFVREAQVVNQIGHPNIVDVFGFGQLVDGRCFFVMDWLTGETLRERLLRPLPLAEALAYLQQIATALDAAHRAGVVHRDLKPDNVFLAADGHGAAGVKLLDFGLAKLRIGGNAMDTTRTGVVMGTPLYLSPEQAKGVSVDFPTDIYSLGAIAYEMVSRRVPFTADSAIEIMAKHISEPALPLSQVIQHPPPALDRLVLAMLEKVPARRPTIAQVREQLAAIAAQPLTDLEPLRPVVRRSRRALWIGGAIAAAVALGTGAYALRGVASDDHEEPATATKPVAAAPVPAPTAAAPISTPSTTAPPSPSAPADPTSAPVATASPTPAPPEPGSVPASSAKSATAKPSTGALTIHLGGVAAGEIYVDGKLMATQQHDWTGQLAAGPHRLRATASSGRASAVTTVKVSAGGKTAVTLQVEPRKSDSSVLGWDD